MAQSHAEVARLCLEYHRGALDFDGSVMQSELQLSTWAPGSRVPLHPAAFTPAKA